MSDHTPGSEKCWSHDEERFEGDFESVCDSAFDDAYPDEPDTITIWEGDSIMGDAGFYLSDASGLLESACERAYDECGDCSEGWLEDVTREQEKELTETFKAAFNAWCDKYGCQPKFGRVENVRAIKVRRIGDNDYEIVEEKVA